MKFFNLSTGFNIGMVYPIIYIFKIFRDPSLKKARSKVTDV